MPLIVQDGAARCPCMSLFAFGLSRVSCLFPNLRAPIDTSPVRRRVRAGPQLFNSARPIPGDLLVTPVLRILTLTRLCSSPVQLSPALLECPAHLHSRYLQPCSCAFPSLRCCHTPNPGPSSPPSSTETLSRSSTIHLRRSSHSLSSNLLANDPPSPSPYTTDLGSCCSLVSCALIICSPHQQRPSISDTFSFVSPSRLPNSNFSSTQKLLRPKHPPQSDSKSRRLLVLPSIAPTDCSIAAVRCYEVIFKEAETLFTRYRHVLGHGPANPFQSAWQGFLGARSGLRTSRLHHTSRACTHSNIIIKHTPGGR